MAVIRICDYCGDRIASGDNEYLIEATRFKRESGTERTATPAMPAMEACPLCFDQLRPMIQGFKRV